MKCNIPYLVKIIDFMLLNNVRWMTKALQQNVPFDYIGMSFGVIEPFRSGIINSISRIWFRSRTISSFCKVTTFTFSSKSRCRAAFLLVVVSSATTSTALSLLLLRCRPRAASRSCTELRAIFSSFRRSLISLIKVTFSWNYNSCFTVKRRLVSTE